MKKNLKDFAWEISKFLGITAGLLIVLAIYPASKRTLTNSNYIVVNNEETASQTITDCNKGPILVEFKCEARSFPKLLNTFVTSHKDFDFKIMESIRTENPDSAKGFIVTFTH